MSQRTTGSALQPSPAASRSRSRGVRRFVSACLVGAACVATALACQSPDPTAVVTLRTPVDVEALGWCYRADGDRYVIEPADGDACTHFSQIPFNSLTDTWDPFVYVAAIANAGERALQTYSLDTRSSRWLTAIRSAGGAQCLSEEVSARQPGQVRGVGWSPETGGDSPCSRPTGDGLRAFDNDLRTPGNNGIPLPGTPRAVESSHLPAVVWVLTEASAALVAVDLSNGVVIEDERGDAGTPLPFVPSTLTRIPGDSRIVAGNPAGRELLVWDPVFSCGAELDVQATDCDLTLSLGEPVRIATDGPPRHLAASSFGDLYVAADDTPWITRYSLDDGACPPGAPCRIPLTHTCNDGLDNDGNGLIDAEDPSCFRADMNEGDVFPDLPCMDGVDNDGNGLIDALDPGCHGPGDLDESPALVLSPDTCSDGIDNDNDGLIDADDPDCASRGVEFPAGDLPPSHPPASIPRYTARPVYPGTMTLTPDGDILLVSERGGNRPFAGNQSDTLFICGRPLADELRPANALCTTPNTLLPINEGDPSRERQLGLSTGGFAQSIVAWNRVESLPIRNEAGITPNDPEFTASLLGLLSRRAVIASSDGAAWFVDIDRFWTYVDDAGDLTTGYEPLARFNDRINAQAEPRNLRVARAERVPTISGDFTSTEPPGGETFYPSLRALRPELLGLPAGAQVRMDPTNINRPAAFLELPVEPRYCFTFTNLGCIVEASRDPSVWPYTFARRTVDLPADWLIPEEEWALDWEGNLPIGRQNNVPTSRRADAVVLDNSGWIELLGQSHCDVLGGTAGICTMEIGQAACPILRDWCDNGVDLCGQDIDLCDACPAACVAEANLCTAGVQPGDILIIPLLAENSWCRRADGDCTPSAIPEACLGDANTQEPSFFGLRPTANVTIGNEYRVAEVHGSRVRVEPLGFTDRTRYRLPTRLPGPDCFRRPFEIEIVAGDSWVLNGARLLGNDTPYEEVDGLCLPAATDDLAMRRPRPNADDVWTTRWGMRFRISPGDYLTWCATQANPAECRHAMRGFRILFATEDAYEPRAPVALGSLATGASYVGNRNRGVGMVVIVDAGQNQLTAIDANERFTIQQVP